MQLISDFPKEGHHSYEVTVMILLHRVLLMSLNELSAIAGKPMLCKKDSGAITGQTVQVFRRKCTAKCFLQVKKTILERDERFFAIVLLQMDFSTVDT